jgi:cytoskeletal protein CcmA (bactofilin family)
MSIFGSTEKNDLKEEKIIFPNQSTPTLSSFISEDIEIHGNLTGKDYVELNGKITGTLKSNKVDIRQNGSVSGEVSSEHLSIEGEVDGEIKAGDLYIRSTAKIKGIIRYKNIDIQPGAIITAELIRTI